MEKSIYKALTNFDFSKNAALCSIVEYKGSVPRKDYPLMFVYEDGKITGTIGGGRLEHQVIEKVKTVVKSKCVNLESFDLTNTKVDYEGGLCGGTTKVLIEPFTKDIQDFWKSLQYLDNPQNDIVVVTEIQTESPLSSNRYLIYPDSPLESFPPEVAQTIHTVRTKQKNHTLYAEDKFYLVQSILPPPILHIFGAGHVGKAVADLAHFIDLDVHIYDDREEFANRQRFPHAKSIKSDPFSTIINNLQFSRSDYVVVATRGHHQDFKLMCRLLTVDVSYLGLISSQRKWGIISKALADEGFSHEQIDTVHSPIGIDIQSETVPEIAVSIISEIIHHYHTKNQEPRNKNQKLGTKSQEPSNKNQI